MKRIKSGTSVDYGGAQFKIHQLLGEIIALEDVMQYPPTALKYAQVYSFQKKTSNPTQLRHTFKVYEQ